jgi:hypothetical protein
MKKVLILLTMLGLVATPVMAKQQLEAAPVHKHAAAKAKKHAAAKKEKKHLKKKLARRSARKHRIAV